ncbi:MAG: hybrid sensor histidine kinase/response regulator [Opitutales bacterium]
MDSKPIILVIDDTPINLDVVIEALGEDYDLSVAASGEEGLAMVHKRLPELILLDIMMPGLDGKEVCRQLKADPATASIPVIFLTARTAETDIVEGFQLGAVDYITKPFRVAELTARVSSHLEIARNRRIIDRQNAEYLELLHVLCHDLANPLSNAEAALELARTEPEEDYRQEYLELLDQSLCHSSALIRVIRTMRAASDKPLAISCVHLSEAVRSSLSTLQHLLVNKQILVETDVGDHLWVRAEPTTIVNSVLNNLLTNAIKFSYSRSTIRLQARRADDETVKLAITDEGVGIPQEILEQLFEIKAATHRSGTAGESGTGFGMPLVQKFMQLYGGGIVVDSLSEQHGPNHGTTILLTFPSCEPE